MPAHIKAETYIVDQFREMGFADIELQEVHANNQIFYNVIARLGDQKSKDLVVVGAHYDAATTENPGADDNASGVAGLIELARLFKTQNPKLKYPIEFVAYTLEEPPFFDEPQMGSVFHADRLKEQDRNVVLMISLEMIGYYSDKFLSQGFTMPLLYGFYPWTGNFIGIVESPAYGAKQAEITAPALLPGIYFSDHNSYWKHSWPAFMVTDTAFLRNDQYHKPGDTPDRLNYKNMAEVTRSVYAAMLKVTSTDEEFAL